MKIDKSLLAGSNTLLILKLLESKDMYGYEMMEELERRSDTTFTCKAGTLYPLLHKLETQGAVSPYEKSVDGKSRKYYTLTKAGRGLLANKQVEWAHYVQSVNKVLQGGYAYA